MDNTESMKLLLMVADATADLLERTIGFASPAQVGEIRDKASAIQKQIAVVRGEKK